MPVEIPSDSLLNTQIDETEYIIPSYILKKMWVLKDSLTKQDQIVVYDSKKLEIASISSFEFMGRKKTKENDFSIQLFCNKPYEKPILMETKDKRKAIACISEKTNKICNFREIIWDSHYEGKEALIGLDNEGNFYIMIRKESELNVQK